MPGLRGWESLPFILLLAYRLCAGEVECPDDLEDKTDVCLHGYRQMLPALTGGNRLLYTGLDVEVIRSVCHVYAQSMYCIQNLKNACPPSESATIEIPAMQLPYLGDLCSHPNFYELYARHQNCYHRVSPASESCFATFQGDTQVVLPQVKRGQSAALHTMCGFMEKMISCIKDNIEANCDKEAATLVSLLVKPVVETGSYCRYNLTAETQSTPGPDRETTAGSNRIKQTKRNGPDSGATSLSSLYSTYLSVSIGLVFLLHRHVRL